MVALALVVGACGSDDDDGTSARNPVSPTPTTSGSSGTPATSGSETENAQQRLNAVEVTLTQVAELDQPTAFAVRSNDDALYVTEQDGLVLAVRDGELDREPVLDLSDRVQSGGEQGLLGLAFSPDGSKLYVHYSNRNGDNVLDEYDMSDQGADAASRRELLTVEGLQPNHNGGQLVFGPDGYLYIGLGDGGGAGDQGGGHAPGGNGQSLDTLLGKILRIDPEPSAGRAYTLPADNPFAGGGGEPEIWAYGLRNPWRFSFDRETEDLWIGDVGQNAVEEIDFMPAGQGAGANYGWNRLEGSEPYSGDPPEDTVSPIFEYPNPDEGCTVIGGYVYRGTRIPGLDGTYLFSDYCNGTIRAITQRDGEVVAERELFAGPESITAFGEDHDGELYVLAQGSGLLRFDPS